MKSVRPLGFGDDTADSLRARALWSAAERLVQRGLHDVEGLTYQGLGPLAADTLERSGQAIPDRLLHQQRAVRVAALTAPALLAQVRAACEGPILLLKGAEVAERYPGRARGYGDLDLLVPDATSVQRALVEHGFQEVPDPEGLWYGIHHLGRLRWPGSSLELEIHSAPKWPEGLTPPVTIDLLAGAVESAVQVAGIGTPAAPKHAVLLAAHAWAHAPLGRVRDLLDVGALLTDADRGEAAGLAEAWGISRIWRTTVDAIDALVEGTTTWPLRLWAASIRDVRTQTVLEDHVQRLVSPFWAVEPWAATIRAGSALVNEIRPAFDEGWREKASRSAAAFRRAFAPVTRHRELLGGSATRGRRRNTPTDSPP
jgi:Uncharacterised nucleotidyltransferase